MNDKKLIICPRCNASNSIICCALCGDRRNIPKSLYNLYQKLSNKNIDNTIKLKNDFFGRII